MLLKQRPLYTSLRDPISHEITGHAALPSATVTYSLTSDRTMSSEFGPVELDFFFIAWSRVGQPITTFQTVFNRHRHDCALL